MFHMDIDGGWLTVFLISLYFTPPILFLGSIAAFAYIKANHTSKKWLYIIPLVLLVMAIISSVNSAKFLLHQNGM